MVGGKLFCYAYGRAKNFEPAVTPFALLGKRLTRHEAALPGRGPGPPGGDPGKNRVPFRWTTENDL